jgi:SagB-type dehydrogenase family enzyme
MFRDYTIAWEYHRNTVRWPYNTLSPSDENYTIQPFKEYLLAPVVSLPAVDLPSLDFSEMIKKRCSCRNYKKEALGLENLSLVLKAGYGVIGKILIDELEFFERPVPSGGGLYSLELYVISLNVEELARGIYHYSPASHLLEQVSDIGLTDKYISNLFMHQPYLHNSAVIIVITSVIERNMKKYTDRGYRYILLEAGHCVQNMNLISSGLNLGTLNLGGFFDEELGGLLQLNLEEEVPLYCMALGSPSQLEKSELRMPR